MTDRLIRAALMPALLLIALSVAARAQAPSTNAFEGIPNVEFIYYDVTGRTPAAIRASLNAARPADPNDGRRVDAVARWRLQWRWPGDGRGGCDLANATITFRGTVTMPRLVGVEQLPASVQARWRRYLAALEAHEAGHLRHPYERRGEVLAALRASSCTRASDDAGAAVARLGRHDADYDRATRHGATQGATFP